MFELNSQKRQELTSPSWMKCGAMWGKRPTPDGSGMLSTVKAGKCWLMCLVAAKIKSFSNLRSYSNHLGLSVTAFDGWGAYRRHLPLESHEIGKRKTQRIERKHLNLRTRIKRLTKQDYLLFQDGRDARLGNWFVH